MTRPIEAIGADHGLYYKIGLLGKVYFFIGDEWLQSAMSAEMLKSVLKYQKEPFSLVNDSKVFGH